MRYVLEGSVQSVGERMRINAQLVDAESGAHLWAERFDKQRADLLDMQDEVTSRLARTIHIEMIAAESRRAARERPDRLDAVDHALRGRAAWNQHLSLDAARQGRDFFEAALQLDADNVDNALMGVANAHMWEVNMYSSDDRAGQIRFGRGSGDEGAGRWRRTALTRTSPTRRSYPPCARPNVRCARSSSPSDWSPILPRHMPISGCSRSSSGDRARPGPTLRKRCGSVRAIRSFSDGTFSSVLPISISDAWFTRSKACENRSKSTRTGASPAFSLLAGSLALAGLLAEAAAEVCAVARRLVPNFTIAKYRADAISDNPVYLAQRQHFLHRAALGGSAGGLKARLASRPRGLTKRLSSVIKDLLLSL